MSGDCKEIVDDDLRNQIDPKMALFLENKMV